MTGRQLTEALRALGVEAKSCHLVSLLPLVQVAWADGQIQPKERQLILGVGQQFGLLRNGEEQILEEWMREAPSPFFLAHSQRVLLHLAKHALLPGGVDREAVVGWCWALASAAGGLFGTRLMAVSAKEKEVIAQIARQLKVSAVPAG